MLCMLKETQSERSTRIARNLNRCYEAVLSFVHAVQEIGGNIEQFELSRPCEAGEVYVTTGEKESSSLPSHGSREGRGNFEGDKPSVLMLAGRSDRRVRFIIRKDMQEAGEGIAAYDDRSVTLCTDGYSIYGDIEQKEQVDDHLVVTHSDTSVIGDAHTNTHENRHSFFR